MIALFSTIFLLFSFQEKEAQPAEKTEPKTTIEEILTAEYLEKRFALLQPALEKALGEPFSEKIRFVPTKIKEFAGVLTSEMATITEMQENRKLDEDEREDLADLLQGQARLYFAKLDIAGGSIRISLDSFVFMQEMDSKFDCIQEGWFHDILLLHEAVHIWQAKKVDLLKYYGEAKDLSELFARSAVVEGMAQRFAGKAAEILGKKKDFEQFRGVFRVSQTGRLGGFGGAEKASPVLELFDRIVGFPYLEGETFFAGVVESLGESAAVTRVFARPPTTTREISFPKQYLERK